MDETPNTVEVSSNESITLEAPKLPSAPVNASPTATAPATDICGLPVERAGVNYGTCYLKIGHDKGHTNTQFRYLLDRGQLPKLPTGRKTISPAGLTQRQLKKGRASKRRFDARKREEKLTIAEEKALNDYEDTKFIPKPDDAKQILKESRGVSAEHLDLVYKLAIDAARELRLPANAFWFEHGVRQTQLSVETGRPILLDKIDNGEVPGQLLTRCDLHAIWDYSVSWRPEQLSFDPYIQLLLDIKTDFFKLNDICEKDFDRESYESWVELMPKPDPEKLRRGYTQKDMREFLNVSEIKQRLLVASRNSMKSSFILLWLVQQILICPDLRILLVTETNALSSAFVRQLRQYFEVQAAGPTKLQQLFPTYCVPADSGKALEFRCPMAHLGLTIGVACSSMESGGFAGSRNDICVFDDPLSENTVGTEKAIQKTISKYDAIRKLGEVGGLGAVVILTPWAPDDLGSELQTRNEQAEAEGNYTFLAYRIDPAFEIKPHAVAQAKENLLSLTEDDVILRFKRLDWKFIRAEMQAGRAENFKFFRSQNLCSWEGLEDDSLRCTFEETELRARTHPLAFFDPMAIVDVILSIDTAWSVSKHADFSCLVVTKVVKREGKNIAIVTDCDLGRYKISELAIRIVEAIHTNNPTKVVLEKCGAWQSLRDSIHRAAMLRGYLLPYIQYSATNLGGTNAKTKAYRIKSTVEAMIANNTLYFVQANWNEQAFTQLVNFDGVTSIASRKNDFPDALALGLQTFFPGMTQADKSEQQEQAEELAQAAAMRRLHYDRVFGTQQGSFVSTARTYGRDQQPQSAPEPEGRGTPFNIPGLRTGGALPPQQGFIPKPWDKNRN